jgi:uncharacterized protein (TIGR02099 family)
LSQFLRILKIATISVVIFIGLLVGILRMGLPVVSQYGAEINQLLGEAVGLPVDIKKLQVNWMGLTPEVRLVDVGILNPGSNQKAITIKQIRLGLDLPGLLHSGKLFVQSIRVVGASIVIEQNSDGSFVIPGLATSSQQSTGDDDLDWLQSIQHLDIVDSQLTFKKGNLSFNYTDVDLVLSSQSQQHRVQGSVALDGASRNRLAVVAEWQGRLLHPEQSNGRLYLRANNFALASLPLDLVYLGVEVMSGGLDMQLWSRWHDSQLDRIVGSLRLQDVQLKGRNKLKIHSFNSDFDWRSNTDKSLINFSHTMLQINPDSEPMQLGLAMQSKQANTSNGLIVNIEQLELQRIQLLLSLVESANPVVTALTKIKPRGMVKNFRFWAPLQRLDKVTFKASGEVENFGSSISGKAIPGVSGLNLTFALTEKQGNLQLSSQAAEIKFHSLFRNKHEFDTLEGEIVWFKQADKWVVSGHDIFLKNTDFSSISSLKMIFSEAGGSPFIDLNVALKDGNLGEIEKYLPTAIMGKDLVKWLDSALVSGDIPRGALILRGQLADFPYDKGDGRFEVNFDVENVLLDYDKDWPKVSKIAANVVFAEDSMVIKVKKGKVVKSTLLPSSVWIDQLSESTPVHIKGAHTGDISSTLSFIRNSELWESMESGLDGVEGNGPIKVSAKLTIPVIDGVETSVTGEVDFSGTNIARPGQYELENIRGKLLFSHENIEATNITANLLDSPIRIDVKPIDESGYSATRVDIAGKLEASQIRKQFPAKLAMALLGSTTWRANLLIPDTAVDESLPIKLEVQSDLNGLAITMPEPMGKSKTEKKNTLFSTSLGATDMIARLRYAEVGNIVTAYEKTDDGVNLTRANFNFGKQLAQLKAERGLVVGGKVANFSLPQWRDWIFKEDARVSSDSDFIDFERADVEITQLEMLNGSYDDVVFELDQRDGAYLGFVRSKGIEGTFSIPSDLQTDKLVSLNLKHLYLQKLELEADDTTEENNTQSSFDPALIPPISVNIEKLLYQDNNLGSFVLSSKPSNSGLLLESFALKSEAIDLSGGGEWKSKPEESASLHLKFTSPEMGKASALLGYKNTIKDGEVVFEANLNWPGSALDVSLSKLSGHMLVLVNEGRFLEVEPGLGRAFGLLSLGTIQRRLTLDFSDLLQKGLAFDSISGTFDMTNGVAYTSNLEMQSPSAIVKVLGDTDFVNERYDQIVFVIPNVSGNLPVAGAVLGGPAVGAGVLVFQQIFGGDVDKQAQVRYSVEGSWESPDVVRLKSQLLKKPSFLEKIKIPDGIKKYFQQDSPEEE